MGAMYMVFMSAIVLHLVVRVKSSLAVPPLNALLTTMALAPPRRSKRELAAYVNGQEYDCLSLPEQVMVMQDMVHTFILPAMSSEETVHVRSLFITALITCRGTDFRDQEPQQQLSPLLN